MPNQHLIVNSDDAEALADFILKIEEKTGKTVQNIHARLFVHEPGELADNVSPHENFIGLTFLPQTWSAAVE